VSSQSLATVVGSRSEIFINRAKLPARIEVSWPDGNCRFDYQPESDTDPAADGVFTCQ
jgi:outer membrane usher protein FimD/PapC